jgi:hypothetical protein
MYSLRLLLPLLMMLLAQRSEQVTRQTAPEIGSSPVSLSGRFRHQEAFWQRCMCGRYYILGEYLLGRADSVESSSSLASACGPWSLGHEKCAGRLGKLAFHQGRCAPSQGQGGQVCECKKR